jgi:hypothetical protein
MKSRILIATIVVAAMGFLAYQLYFGVQNTRLVKKVFDDRITYSDRTYRPYDTRYALESFKNYAINGYEINLERPDESNEVLGEYNYDSNTVMAIISPYFLPTINETVILQNYVNRGNNLYISALNISPAFMDSLLYPQEATVFYNNYPPIPYEKDSLTITWPKFDEDYNFISEKKYEYPGVKIPNYNEKYFTDFEGNIELAYDADTSSSLVDIPYGAGHFYIQLRPISMTNYFLLHKKNYQYLNDIFEELGMGNRKVIWDSYYKSRRNIRDNDTTIREEPQESYFLDLIMSNKPLLWSVLTFFLGIGLFILLHSRRMQAPINILPDVVNNSVEFSQAISGLYWINQDHKKIAEKLVLQLYDYLSVNFKIFPRDFTQTNLKKLSQKTNKKEEDISQIIQYIEQINKSNQITKIVLMDFYKKAFAFMK